MRSLSLKKNLNRGIRSMQEKRIKSLKLTDPLTIWSRGRRGRDVGTSGNRRCRAAPRKLRAGRGLSPGFGLPWEASGGDRQGMLTPTACPSGLPPAASCTQGCGTTAQSKRRLATGNWGGRHLRGPGRGASPACALTLAVAIKEDKVQTPSSGSPCPAPAILPS